MVVARGLGERERVFSQRERRFMHTMDDFLGSGLQSNAYSEQYHIANLNICQRVLIAHKRQ